MSHCPAQESAHRQAWVRHRPWGRRAVSAAGHVLTRARPPLLAPQIRKAAQHGVCSVLKGSEFMFGEKAPAHHPAAVSTAKFCIQEIEKAGGGEPGRQQGRWGPRPAWEDGAHCRGWAGGSAPSCLPGSKEATTTLHMLTLLKDVLPCFPEGLVKSCSETLLRVMTLSHVVSSTQELEEHAGVAG